jgi:hypothetical protein
VEQTAKHRVAAVLLASSAGLAMAAGGWQRVHVRASHREDAPSAVHAPTQDTSTAPARESRPPEHRRRHAPTPPLLRDHWPADEAEDAALV